MKTKIILLLVLCLSAVAVNAQTDDIKIPVEVKPFVEKGSKAIALESADLNGDGKKDFVLVLEREMSEAEDEYPNDQRPLLILVRDKNNKLSEAKRNERMVMCSQCGGIFGDPFAGVKVGKKTFTVNHYGGSAWRWTADYTFNYSRIDKTWQLVKIEKTSYHNVRPMKETLEKTVLTPPKDYGKVDIADFDPADYEENPDEDSETSVNLITPDSAGNVKIGMTVAGARKVLKGHKFERTSDGEGVALIGVNKEGSEYIMTIYAGEEDREAKINENARIEMIEVWFSDHQTAEGVHPRMKVSDVEKKYGKLKEIMMSEIESREFATFADQPKGLQFRVLGEGKDAGKYKQGEMKTTSYTPGAYLHSIQVWGIDENSDNKEMAEDFKSLDIGDFNKKIKKAAASNEAWVKRPMFVIANILEPFAEMKSRNIKIAAPFADAADSLTIVVVDDGYADDSVRGMQYKFNLKLNDQGIWQVISAKKAQRCWEGRGHEDYSAAPCI